MTFLRILVLAAIFAPPLIGTLALPMGAMAATGLTGAALVWLLSGAPGGAAEDIGKLANPLELGAALSFGLFLAAVLLAVHDLSAWLGTGGVHVAAALSGMTDVDAPTISVSRLATEGMETATAAKGAISLIAGNRALGLRVIAVYALAIGTGALALWLGA